MKSDYEIDKYTLTTIACGNCGGPLHPDFNHCSFCSSPLHKVKEEPKYNSAVDSAWCGEWMKSCAGIQMRNPSRSIILVDY